MALRTDAVYTPSKSKSKSMGIEDRSISNLSEDGCNDAYSDDYDFEVFEEPSETIPIDKNIRLPQSPIIVPMDNDDDEDDLDDALLAEEEKKDEERNDSKDTAESENGLDVDGMTLDAYMQMYAKRVDKARAAGNDTGDTTETSPDGVDPQVHPPIPYRSPLTPPLPLRTSTGPRRVFTRAWSDTHQRHRLPFPLRLPYFLPLGLPPNQARDTFWR